MSDIVISLVVSPIIQEALSKAVSFARTHIRISADLKRQMGELEYSLNMMQDLLKVAEDREKRHDAVRKWLQRVEDEAHNLVDLLDKYSYAVHQQNVGTKGQIKNQVHAFSSLFISMPCQIRRIKGSLDNIRRDASIIKLLHNDATVSQDHIETTPYSSDNSEVLGRNDDVSKVVRLLSDLSRQNPLSGLSMVGMPGIGKTTLARSICNRAEEENLYDLVAWVCLSKNFDVKMILKAMLEYLDSNGGSMVNTGAILKRLKSKLEDKRFLLVLDDVWNEDPRSWKTLFSYLLNISTPTGNSIVVTTSRKQVVASTSVMDEVPMHKYELQKLSAEECRLIMGEKILRSSRITTIPMDLLNIAEQCGGLPLVAAVIGEALSHHTDADEWLAIKNNTAWDSPHRMEIVSKLKKSFDHLPSPLKKCFSYCSIFPKGFEIRRDDLVQLWLAGGLLHQSDDSKSEKEEVGDKYLNDLVSSYLFQDVMDECGNIKFCKMHDEVHNLALFISKYETCIWSDSCPIEEGSSFRHMRVIFDDDRQAIPSGVADRLRSLFLEVDVFRTRALPLRSLQSLKLAAVDRKKLQEYLGKLKYHMKYLDISESDIKGLPESVTKLYNLQTLRFMGCRSLMDLPSDIGNLVSLRHIHVNDESHMPRGVGKLTSLQTLPLFVVGTKKGQRIEELKDLSQLRGKLKICNLEQVRESEATEAKLEAKVKLFKLQFVWSRNRAISNNNDEVVLDRLQPHSNLKSLTIENYKGVNFPSWMVKDVSSSASSFRLNSIVKLKLIDCDECGDILCLGLLPKLKVLNIRAMSKVKRIGSTFYYNRSNIASSSQGVGRSITPFPALRKLILSNMTKLEEWTAEDTDVFPSLDELHIKDCPEFKTWWIDGSASPMLSILSIHSCPNLQAIPRRLLNLISLDINDSCNLMGYAKEYTKWCTICHIHSIRINGLVVRYV
ncbi:hypothetical protein SLEP1_g58461 [Rubroshorea leprosula]|uniref:AAA+ ATPase domain-containing protein n=1 Tax=Rubroshorea leprosula TaxID=152421 RepID=A0AAV5MTX6_9ROSI|nr:hypothetical protein SLEP1_g58461 [Rubroshorea leprosula]